MPARRVAWVSWVARLSLGGIYAFLVLTAATLTPGDRSIFGIRAFDARPLYGLVGVGALAVIFVPRLRPVWLALMPVVMIGRAASLLVLGSPDLPRALEIRGAVNWCLLFGYGLLSVLVLEGAAGVRSILEGDLP